MNDFTPAGSWFLEADGSRFEMTIFESHNRYSGVIAHQDGYSEIISNVSWDPQSFSLDFWWDSLGQWCRATVVEGVAGAPKTIQAAQEAPQDFALYELAAALAPVFASMPRETGATGAVFGNFLFTPSVVGPCCRLKGDRSQRAAS